MIGRAAERVRGLVGHRVAQPDRLAQHADGEAFVRSTGRFAQLADPLDRRPHAALRRALGQPAVAQLGGAAHRRRRRATHPDRRAPRARRGRADPHLVGAPAFAGQGESGIDVARVGRLERGAQHADRLLQRRTATVEVGVERLELTPNVACTDAHDRPASGQRIEGGEALGGNERVTVGEHVHVAEQPQVGAAGAQPCERGHRVVPGGADVDIGRHRHVVTHRHVPEAGLVGSGGDAGQIARTGLGLPGLGERRAFGLDRQLDPPQLLTLPNDARHRLSPLRSVPPSF